MATGKALSRGEFESLRDHVQRTLGIHLVHGKMAMVEQRLRPLLASHGHDTFGALVRAVQADPAGALGRDFVSRITTNHTYFNREAEHFAFLRERALPEHVAQLGSTKAFRMWCAAASRGHEPYTLAMIQREFFGRDYGGWDAGLLATDISEQALGVALLGRYPAEEVRALPAKLRDSYFRRLSSEEYEVNEAVKRDVLYRKFNLCSENYPFRKPFDVVFCRNVLIYFDPPTKLGVVEKIRDKLRPGGYLFVGLAESLGREIAGLRYIQPGIYLRVR